MPWSGLDPQLVWGLLPRFVGLLYIVAFGSLAPQLVGLIGSRGTAPLAPRLARIRQDFPGVRRFFELPTVFWFNASDTAIRIVPWLGVLCGVLVCYGGDVGYAASVCGWILWLSVEPAGTIFPWDTLLQEVGFLVLFVPRPEELPNLSASALPLPTVAFMFRWLVLRLMLGFAKVKFIGSDKSDALYLRGFLIWAPLPTPLAWWGHHAPRWFLKASLGFMFFAEVVAPVLGLFAGPLRLVSFATLAALMLGVHATGNWGYFNIGYVLLCTCLLDVDASLLDLMREPWASRALSFPDAALHALMAVLFLNSLVYFLVFNTWVTRTWVHWPWETVTWKRPWARALIGWFRVLAPFRLTNGYGVFPPNAAAPVRLAPVVEGSVDGKTFHPYGYKYLPTTSRSRLKVFAPHHPRFDQTLHYAALSFHDASMFGSLIGDGNPYGTYLKTCWLERAAQRLLTDGPEAARRFGHNPFPNESPKFVRISMYVLAATTPAERRATGELWHVRRTGTLVPARGPSPHVYEQAVAVPELFHIDFVHLKRRAKPLRAIVSAYEAGADADRAVLAESECDADEVAHFRDELIPATPHARGDLSQLAARAECVREQFGPVALYRFERLLHRFTWLLRHRTEPHFDGRATPKLELESTFRYELLLHEVVGDGREACAQLLAEPVRIIERLAQSRDETQLWLLALVRFDTFMWHVRTFRWHDFGHDAYRRKLPGISEYYPLLSRLVPPDEEFVPQSIKHPDGEFTVPGIYTRPGVQPQSA